jgi:CRP/FNR family cyclic AMP-dependent transcriptional regulator
MNTGEIESNGVDVGHHAAPLAGQHAVSDVPMSAEPLAHIPLFSQLVAAEQQALFASMKVLRVDANQTIFWRGDRGDSLYLINQGQVIVTVPSDEGEHVALDQLGPGGFFGEIGLLDGGPRTATVRATTPTELYVLSRADFHSFLRQRPEAAIEILTVMGQRQRSSTDALRGLKNPNLAFEQSRVTTWQRASDIITRTAGSQWFVMFHLAWFFLWVGANLLADHHIIPHSWGWDPFPFGLLTMVVSLEAIFLSIFVMVSQNRQAEKDRLRTDLDYQVNVKAQTEILEMARKIDSIEAHLLSIAPPPSVGDPPRQRTN